LLCGCKSRPNEEILAFANGYAFLQHLPAATVVKATCPLRTAVDREHRGWSRSAGQHCVVDGAADPGTLVLGPHGEVHELEAGVPQPAVYVLGPEFLGDAVAPPVARVGNHAETDADGCVAAPG
jgi:hypothetical protein